MDQANSDHEAELVFSSSDGNAVYLTVTFTPAANASTDIKENGVESELYLNTTMSMQYNGKDIFSFKNPGDGVLNNIFPWTKGEGGVFTYTLDENDLKEQIKLNGTFVLDTKADHDAFGTALAGNVIIARVTDGTVN